MYFLNELCCICMNNSDLKNLFAADDDGVSHYNKLTSSIAEMHFKEMNDQRLICGECCVTLNTVYNFRQTCLRSKTNLINYLSQLQTSSSVSGTLSVRLTEVVHEIIVVKEEIEIECENKYIINENNQIQEFQTESFEDSIYSPAHKEWESGEEASSAHEDTTVDHMTECDVNLEDVELQTMMQDEDYIEYTEIDIKEEPLTEITGEPMSDTETPQDGSTSQADVQKTVGGPHMCEICKKVFFLKKYLTNHMKYHSSERPYECEKCKKRFTSKTYLATHVQIHSSRRPYECEICKKRFSLRQYYRIHKKIHSVERQHECEICKKKFIFKKSLHQHMQIHSYERPYECEICNKNFSHSSTFNIHMRIHSGEGPYECEICHKTCKSKSQINAHSLTHGDKRRPFECEICKKGYQTKRYLEFHLKTHSGERKYECELCKKTFVCKVSFKSHIRIHGERPFECEICHRSFYNKSHLNSHLKIHGESCFKCEICKKGYTMQRYLDTHMKKHFGDRKISEMFIKEEPTEVKEEPMSDTETTQDGSTSQAYA